MQILIGLNLKFTQYIKIKHSMKEYHNFKYNKRNGIIIDQL